LEETNIHRTDDIESAEWAFRDAGRRRQTGSQIGLSFSGDKTGSPGHKAGNDEGSPGQLKLILAGGNSRQPTCWTSFAPQP
jgi:hypothetical protein